MMDNGLTEGNSRLERKLATILSADVAEYSRLMAEDEEQTLRTFQTCRKIFESIVAGIADEFLIPLAMPFLSSFRVPLKLFAARRKFSLPCALVTTNSRPIVEFDSGSV
jgi:hypothetical protein